MPNRSFYQYFIITAKGLAMGAADVVPGVSGGTIAFISGIYEELIETIHKLDLGFFSTWKNKSLKIAWADYNLSFLTALLLGIAISIISFAKLITWLLETHPIPLWSFFFGLVLASILFVGKQVTLWNFKTIAALIIASILSYLITIADPVGSPESTWFLFIAGFIAIIAMILPGISGAFILLLMGAYTSVIRIITQLGESVSTLNWELFSKAFGKLLVFGLGAILGIKIFSKALNWMFKYHKNLILAVLTGFMVGALNKIWPWKKVLEYRTDSHGNEVPFIDKSILPTQYPDDPEILMALVFCILGFLSIYLLERFAAKKL